MHLELFAALQRLGLIRSTQLLPTWRYFVPFTEDSLIPAPPPLANFTIQSLLQWAGQAFISATPLLLWALTPRAMKDWQPGVWQRVISRLPSPIFRGRAIGPLPPEQAPANIPPPPPDSPPPPEPEIHEEPAQMEDGGDDVPQSTPEGSPPPAQQSPGHVRRQSLYSAAGVEDYGSDDDEHEVVSAALISFDVEATEATDVPPQGLWSAELRPSVGPEPRAGSALLPTYLSTMLTRLPSLMAAKIMTDAIVRLSIAPYEAMALRLAARAFCAPHGLPSEHILGLHLLSGLNLTWFVNFFGTELAHLVLSGEVWSMFTSISQYFHMSEEEWNEYEGKEWGDWFGPFYSGEPLF